MGGHRVSPGLRSSPDDTNAKPSLHRLMSSEPWYWPCSEQLVQEAGAVQRARNATTAVVALVLCRIAYYVVFLTGGQVGWEQLGGRAGTRAMQSLLCEECDHCVIRQAVCVLSALK